MPFSGPETDIVAPPLIAPPTGLLQSVTLIEHPLLESAGYLAKLVGPDAADTILAAAVTRFAHELLPEAVSAPDETDREWQSLAEKQIEELPFQQREQLRMALIAAASDAMVAAPQGGFELGANPSDGDPFAHWLAGVRWVPENDVAPELFDPCTDSGTSFVVFSGGSGSGATGVSRKATRTGQAFGISVRDACSSWGWKEADYAGRAIRGLLPRETVMVEREFMHGDFMGASRSTSSTPDGTNTNGSNAFSSPTLKLTQADVGKKITGALSGIPANTYIGTVVSATSGTFSSSPTSNVSVNATVTRSGTQTFTIASKAGGSNRFLSDSNCHIYDTGAVDPTPVQALAYANEAIAKANIGQGMIHVSAFFLELVAASGYLLKTDSRGRLLTLNGNIVVTGNGYDGVGPDGTGGPVGDASGKDSGHDHEWIYVSDIPVIWRPPQPEVFPATLREAMKMTVNEVTFRAMRPYAIAWSAELQSAIKCKVI